MVKKETIKKFKGALWQRQIDVRDFVFQNITPYDGDSTFLAGPSKKTKALWSKCQKLILKERKEGFEIDTKTISTLTSHGPGYVDKDLELIVGLQTDKPLKRAIKPLGGIRVVQKACQEYGCEVDEKIVDLFTNYRKTHNDAVFDAYSKENLLFRKLGIITGLPDNYARGRIIGDYRRVALYGVDHLIEQKLADKEKIAGVDDESIRLREEVAEQVKALKMLKKMAASYGIDISAPAQSAKEAVQWTYFAFLASVKEHDGAAMSVGNVSNFFDIFIERDLKSGKLTEPEAQELIDQFVIKLRLVRHLRPKEYDELFAGDPTWATESLGGVWQNGQHKVTKSSYRFLQTLYNLGPGPEPNLTVLWANNLPEYFRDFCTKVSIDTSSIQYENDDVMRRVCKTDDYGISCCVSLLKSGTMMQYFGARCNLAKVLLLALNGGVDELTQVKAIEIAPLKNKILDYTEVMKNFRTSLAYTVKIYVEAMNIIHYMHDKYYYERAQMALLNTHPERVMAFGIAGLSVVADSLSAIKFAHVTAQKTGGVTTSFKTVDDYPRYGNSDQRVDSIAKELVDMFMKELNKQKYYRNARPTLSVLTITSNVVYGKKTGATPDGRLKGEPFAPGANPMHGRDVCGAIASLNSVAKLNYENAQDGISNTFTVTPSTLGADKEEQIENLATLIGGYFSKGAHHLNVNVLNRETLIDAMAHPEEYANLTIRVSGYAVNFVKLGRHEQEEVIARTFFDRL